MNACFYCACHLNTDYNTSDYSQKLWNSVTSVIMYMANLQMLITQYCHLHIKTTFKSSPVEKKNFFCFNSKDSWKMYLSYESVLLSFSPIKFKLESYQILFTKRKWVTAYLKNIWLLWCFMRVKQRKQPLATLPNIWRLQWLLQLLEWLSSARSSSCSYFFLSFAKKVHCHDTNLRCKYFLNIFFIS